MSFMDYWKKFTNTNDEEDYEENQFEAQEESFDNRSFSNVSSYEDYERESPRTVLEIFLKPVASRFSSVT